MKLFIILISAILFLTITSCGDQNDEIAETLESIQQPVAGDDPDTGKQDILPACLQSLFIDQIQPVFFNLNCRKANKTQLKEVNQGNLKRERFLSQCYKETKNSCWCDQLVRPNPESMAAFECTYGEGQAHQLIHPNEKTWKYAFEAVKIVEEFEDLDLQTKIIYNWWRPEPYNKNVGGSATRHPHGTSIDIRFETKAMQNKAFSRLCKMRARGRLRAIGYYPSTAIHLGIGDGRANTWGKSCP